MPDADAHAADAEEPECPANDIILLAVRLRAALATAAAPDRTMASIVAADTFAQILSLVADCSPAVTPALATRLPLNEAPRGGLGASP
jgi:hypothetical protein